MSSNVEEKVIDNVLIATDGSAHAEAAVEYGAWLAARTGASATAVYVIDARRLAVHFIRHFSEIVEGHAAGVPARVREAGLLERVREYYHAHGLRVLERAAAVCERYGVACRTELETGSVVKILAERAPHADLLVMGKHGEDVDLETGFLGSVAEKVVRKVGRPVLMAQPPFREFKRALLAYDGSA